MEKDNPVNPFTTKRDREIFFDVIERQIIYKFRFLDVCKSEAHRIANGGYYFHYDCQSLDDYDEIDIKNGDLFIIHIPCRSFQNALNRMRERIPIFNKDDDIDLIVHLQRKNDRVIKIHNLEVIDLNEVFEK